MSIRINIAELHEIALEEYIKLRASGMFWVHFPEATGDYTKDLKLAEEARYKDVPKP